MADVDVTEAEVIAPARTEAGHAPEPVATSETVPAQTVPAPAVEAAPVETQPVPPAVQEPTTKEPTTKEPAAEQAPTRVEMVDVHLARLTAKGRGVSPDVDALLDARTRYQQEESA